MTSLDAMPQSPEPGSFICPETGNRKSFVSYLVGFVGLCGLALILFTIGSLIAYFTLVGAPSDASQGQDLAAALEEDWRILMAFVAIQYGAIAVALFVVVKFWHGRPALSVLTSATQFRWTRFGLGVAVLGAIHLVLFVISIPFEEDLTFKQPALTTILALIAVSMPVLLLQTTTEEAVARGYLFQLLGSARLAAPIVLALSSLIFAAAHLGNPEMESAPIVFAGYFTIGLVFAYIAWREGGLELAAGAHFINNLFATVILRTEDSVFQTPALFVTAPFSDYSMAMTLFSILSAPILLILAYLYLVSKPQQN